MQVGDGLIHNGDAVGILSADVEHARFRSGIPTGDHHAEQHAMRLLLHEVFVDVGTGIAFVGIADDVFHLAFSSTAARPLDGKRETSTTTASQAAVLQFHAESIACAFGDQLFEGSVVVFDAFELCGQNRRLEVGDDGVAVLTIALAGFEKVAESSVRLAGVVFALVLQRCAFMAATEAADVADLFFGKVAFERVMELVLRACAQTGAAVADEHFLALVLLLEEVVEANRAERDGIAKEMILAHLVDKVVLFGGAVFFGCFDHAFEDVLFDAFAKGEGAEVFGHGGWPAWRMLFVTRRLGHEARIKVMEMLRARSAEFRVVATSAFVVEVGACPCGKSAPQARQDLGLWQHPDAGGAVLETTLLPTAKALPDEQEKESAAKECAEEG